MDETTPQDRLKAARDLLVGYPEGTLAATEKFLGDRDPAALDALLLGVLEKHLPPKEGRVPLVAQPGAARLIEDLGFDSLALVEVNFLLQDITGLKLPEAEMRDLRTLDDLRAVLRRNAARL